VTPEERDLRRALEARSGEPSPQFRARLTAAFDEGRPPSGLMQAVAMVAVVAITLGTVGVLLLSRNARSHQGVASGTRIVSPTPSPASIPMPNTAQLMAPSSNVVWVLVAGSVLFRSTDQGNTWEQRALPTQPIGRNVSFINDHEGWALAPGSPETQCSGASAVVWHTTDAGASWEQISSVLTAQKSGNGIALAQCKQFIYFYDSTHGFVTAWDDNHRPTIYRTSDAGKTWSGSTLPDPPDFKTSPGGFTLQARVFRRFGNTLYVVASGRQEADIAGRQYMFRSADGGATWSWLTKIPSPYVAMVTESRWLQLMVPGQSMESINGGQQWHLYASDFNSDTPVGGPQIVFADAQVGYAEGRGALQRTVDGGFHWVRIATPGTTPPIPTPSPSSTPPPIPLLPVTDPGFTCRLPVDSMSGANPLIGGFLAIPGGSFKPDLAASLIAVTGQRWSLETSARPVLRGTAGLSFDAPASRWVPADPEVISSDGATYAWTEREVGTPNLLHVTRVADGSDRTFAAGPPQPQDPDLQGHGAFIPVPIGITTESVFLTYGWEGTWGVWRLDLASGSLTKVSGMKSPSYGAGAIWLELTRGPFVGMYSAGDTLARLDLKTGAVQDWYHRDSVVVRNLGFDVDSNPLVQAITYDNYVNPRVLEIWRVRGPGQADLILSSQRISRVITDKHGTWFGNETGVYLYSGGRLQRVSVASVGEVVGPCV
jgi:photosystem II stability/assembly factor-like uncharacterized protein